MQKIQQHLLIHSIFFTTQLQLILDITCVAQATSLDVSVMARFYYPSPFFVSTFVHFDTVLNMFLWQHFYITVLLCMVWIYVPHETRGKTDTFTTVLLAQMYYNRIMEFLTTVPTLVQSEDMTS